MRIALCAAAIVVAAACQSGTSDLARTVIAMRNASGSPVGDLALWRVGAGVRISGGLVGLTPRAEGQPR